MPEPDWALEPEYREHFVSWKRAPTPQNTAAVLGAVRPVLDTALRMYAPGAGPALAGRAKVLAVEALGRYDPARAKLRTHLLSHLRGLQRHAARAQQTVALPERAALELGRLSRGRAELADRLGRDPTADELADHTGVAPARQERLLKARPGLTEGQAHAAGEEGEVLAPAVVRSEARSAWERFVHGELAPTDRLIMEHTMGLYGRPVLSKTELARRLGVSVGAVSQRAARIQARLDLQEHTGGLF